MSKFKVGDKVRILDGRMVPNYTGNWVSPMDNYVGQIAKISAIYEYLDGRVGYDLEGHYFTWDERCLALEPKSSSHFTITSISGLEIRPLRMPNIKNYTYTPHIGLTTIEWSDGTKTTVRAENPARADQYTGFVTAYAKKAAGNTNNINNLFDEWAIERPKREAKRMSDEMVACIEAQKKQERENKKREKRIIRREALRLKREYEAKKLAKEKYGVPVDEL